MQVPYNIARVWRPLCDAAMASDQLPGEGSSAPAMLGILHIADDGPENERVSAGTLALDKSEQPWLEELLTFPFHPASCAQLMTLRQPTPCYGRLH